MSFVGDIKLRPYQAEAVKTALEHDNGILVLPTGSGKSIVCAGIVDAIEGQIVVLQPSKEILESNLDKIKAISFEDIGVFSASMGVKEVRRITYATIGSIIKHLDKFRNLSALLIDECHLVNAKGGQYQEFIKATCPKKLIGMTATPYRLHSTAWGSNQRVLSRTRPKMFDRIIHITETMDLVNEGFLFNPEFFVSGKDSKHVLRPNSTGAEFSSDSIAKYLEVTNAVDRVKLAVAEAISLGQKHILVFTPELSFSSAVVDAINGMGVTAETVTGTTPKKIREERLEKFRSGEIRVIVNVGVLTTGYDFPALDCIVSTRPTMSLSLYYQIIGRCVRPHPEKKRVIVYDLVDNYGRFGNPLEMRFIETGKDLIDILSRHGRLTTRNILDGPECEEVIKWGKYQGKRLRELPLDYLEWCVGNFKQDSSIRTLKAEIARRQIYGLTQPHVEGYNNL